MVECLNNIKVPSRFSSNIKRIINVQEKKFLNLKSYDSHVLMTQLLPVVLRGILPPHVCLATVKLCAFTVLQNSSLVDPYIKVHKDFIRFEWPGKNEAWIRRHHIETFALFALSLFQTLT